MHPRYHLISPCRDSLYHATAAVLLDSRTSLRAMHKRKSDVVDDDAFDASNVSNAASSRAEQPKAKKARTSKASESADASTSSVPTKGKGKGTKAKEPVPSRDWWEIVLEGEEDVSRWSHRSPYYCAPWLTCTCNVLHREASRSSAYASPSHASAPDISDRHSDDCNDIRRKIRALQQTPGFKVCSMPNITGTARS